MKPRGLLMMEHRIIEKMIAAMKKEIASIRENGSFDPVFVDTAIDFIRTYADRNHKGKEEDIMFRELEQKKMSPDDVEAMNELTREHVYGRQLVKELNKATDEYRRENKDTGAIADKLQAIADFYPAHIEKEDKSFFPDTERYFSENELQKMIDEFHEFDCNMIHRKYREIAENIR